jgi:hypothetical protein
MIRVLADGVFKCGLSSLAQFAEQTDVRGRFVAMYLGLKRMGVGIAELGATTATPAAEIQRFLDHMFTKTERPAPLVVLTDLFGLSTSPTAPWSTLTNERAPNNKYPTNTWRNNFGIQKGVGCPAEPDVINELLATPQIRLACPNMTTDDEGRTACGLLGTNYRGEEHSIWLRLVEHDGYQVVDLDNPAVYSGYLLVGARSRIPIFALIAVLYCNAPDDVYPNRDVVGIPEFAEDFNLTVDQVEQLFECDPDSLHNAQVVAASSGGLIPPDIQPANPAIPRPLPLLAAPSFLNTGVGAEIEVAHELERNNWTVSYTGNVRSLGYDLEARQAELTLRVEVKSSFGLCRPELTTEEWTAAARFGDEYVLAIVDFFGSAGQRMVYVRNPAANAFPTERQVSVFGISRQDITALAVEAEFL